MMIVWRKKVPRISFNLLWTNHLSGQIKEQNYKIMWSYSNMDGPRDGWTYHTKYVRQKKTNTMWNHSYVESNFKKWHKWTYLQNKNRLTEIENRTMVTKGGVWRRWINQEFGINTLTLLYSSIGVCCVLCLVTQSCLTLCNPIARLLCQEIFQVRILEWVAIPSSRGSSQTRDQTQVSSFADGLFTLWAIREAP